jgi:hypothetical protein
LAVYYGEDEHDIEKYYVFTDSYYVHSVGLSYYHFDDTRDTSDEMRYWKTGVIAINSITGNVFVFATVREGYSYSEYSDFEFRANKKFVYTSGHFKLPKANESFPLYQDTFFNNSSKQNMFDVFAHRNTGAALKLSAILNDLPHSVKQKMTRNIMDSVITNFLFTGNESDPLRKALTEEDLTYEIKMTAKKPYFYLFTGSTTKRKIDTNSVLNNPKNQIELLRYFKEKAQTKNVFTYLTSSTILFEDNNIMVVINEGLPESLDHQSFFSTFNCEPIMYSVKIYTNNL